jgi:hypothetical protein
MGVMVDLYCASYTTPPAAVTLDIDDTVDPVARPAVALSCGRAPRAPADTVYLAHRNPIEFRDLHP